MEVFISEIKLPGKDEFSKKFNHVSDLFRVWVENETDENWQAYFYAKVRFRNGLLIK